MSIEFGICYGESEQDILQIVQTCLFAVDAQVDTRVGAHETIVAVHYTRLKVTPHTFVYVFRTVDNTDVY